MQAAISRQRARSANLLRHASEIIERRIARGPPGRGGSEYSLETGLVDFFRRAREPAGVLLQGRRGELGRSNQCAAGAPRYQSCRAREAPMTTEAKCPFSHTTWRRTTNTAWWPHSSIEPAAPALDPAPIRSVRSSTTRGVAQADFAALEEGSRGADDRLAGLVAGRLSVTTAAVRRMAWHSAARIGVGDGRGGGGRGQQALRPSTAGRTT